MGYVDVNWLAVLAAGVAAFFIGWLWYIPPLFGRMWMKWTGVKKSDVKKEMKQTGQHRMLVSIIAHISLAFGLAMVMSYAPIKTVWCGLCTAAVMWLAFVGATSIGRVLWELKPLKLWILDNAYYLTIMLLMSLVFFYWV